MTYVLSDLHGFSEMYFDFLDAVKFCDDDVLYIIGDVLDRGSDGIKIIKDIMNRNNVILIKGNHEHMLLPTLSELSYSDKQTQIEIIRDEVMLQPIGQQETLNDFICLSRREQLEIIDFLNSLEVYKEITVCSQKYMLVHAGLPDFEDKLDIEYYTEEELLFGAHDFDIDHFDDTIIIVGHVPTRFINAAEPDKIFRKNDSIGIDCGLGFGGQLGVLCLETGEEFYFYPCLIVGISICFLLPIVLKMLWIYSLLPTGLKTSIPSTRATSRVLS